MSARLLTLPAALAAGLALAACGGTSSSAPPVQGLASDGGGRFAGAEISPPFEPPTGSFDATTGGSYDLAQQVKGTVTLVYFGYTHCPDVCPTTMADLGSAIRGLPAATQRDVHVDFVTSDPDHDTPAVMQHWLASFDSGLANPFVGLRTGLKPVQAYAAKVGVQLEDPTTDAKGDVTDQHAAQVLAFSPDGSAHLVWTPGTTVAQYRSDIAKLVRGVT